MHGRLLFADVLVCLPWVQPAALQILMPPLQDKWTAIPDTDRELLPLFECFTSLAQALGALTVHPFNLHVSTLQKLMTLSVATAEEVVHPAVGHHCIRSYVEVLVAIRGTTRVLRACTRSFVVTLVAQSCVNRTWTR